MYIYLSNEEPEPLEVFFDDFGVEHVKSPVVQVDDYYPFGLTYNSYKRENSVENKVRFQGQEHVDDLGLNWDSFKWRNHQPDIGRFFNIDPLAERYVYNSTYAFSENQVVAHRELEGLESQSIHLNQEIKKIVHFQNSMALANALIVSGKQFDSFYYPDEAHNLPVSKRAAHLFTLMTNYILENL